MQGALPKTRHTSTGVNQAEVDSHPWQKWTELVRHFLQGLFSKDVRQWPTKRAKTQGLRSSPSRGSRPARQGYIKMRATVGSTFPDPP